MTLAALGPGACNATICTTEHHGARLGLKVPAVLDRALAQDLPSEARQHTSGTRGVIERLLPKLAASAEVRGRIVDVELFPEEERSLGDAVEKRRREFVTGRACAREALQRLGVAAGPIPSGERGEPLWAPGIVGSITHCEGYCAAAVAEADSIVALGIDAEPNTALPAGVLDSVAFGPERDLEHVDGQLRIDRLLFSAKEAVYKAWFPLSGRALSFEQVCVSFDRATAEFCATLHLRPPVIDGVPLTGLRGRWCVDGGVILTAVVVPRRGEQ